MRLLGLILTSIIILSPAKGEKATEIAWKDLIPNVELDDPYLKLTKEQRSLIWDVAMAEMAVNNGSAKNPETEKKVHRLAEMGVDAKQVIDDLRQFVIQKEEISKGMVSELNGARIRMGGFLLPLDISENKSKEFLLVPWVGACIHTPPPPKNQIVYIQYSEGRKIEKQYEPVWVEGEMLVEEASNALFLVDGTDDIKSGYRMKPNSIEAYK